MHALYLALAAAPAIYFWAIKPYARQRRLTEEAQRETEVRVKLARQQANRETEETLFDIIHDSPVAIGITDESGQAVYWNPQFRRLGHRLGDAEERGNVFQAIFSNPKAIRTLQERVRRGEKVREEEVELVSPTGERAWAEVSMQELTFEGKKSLLTWIYDITARKMQEETQREARVAAEEANRAKSAFLAAMSHEIRTPLNGIIAMADMLERAELVGEHRSMAAIMKESSGILMNVINDILDYSKIESGKLELDRAGFSLVRVVEGVGDLFGVQAFEKGLRLFTYVDPAIHDHLEGDPARIRQIIGNLTGNAVKFTRSGEVAIEALAAGEDEKKSYVKFQIRDTGIGIAPEAVDKLFKPFSQADNSTSRRFGGTGLGLSICKALVEAMGGSIGVDSKPGEGSVFWFKLPLAKRPERRATRRVQLAGRAALVVTDNKTFAEAAKSYFAFAGARASVVAGPEGVRSAARRQREGGHAPDILLVDGAISEEVVGAVVGQAAGNPDLAGAKILAVLDRTQMLSSKYARRADVFADLPRPLRRGQLLGAAAAAVGIEELDAALSSRRRAEDKERPLDYVAPDRQAALDNNALILVAEDNPVNRNVIRMLFERLGLAADIVHNGALALLALGETRYGMLVTDCHMPEMDGYQLTAAIREEEKKTGGARLPIIALTADAMIGTAERCRQAGMDEYLTKPINRTDLEIAVQKLLPAAMAIRRAKEAGGKTVKNETAALAGEGKPVFDKGYLTEVCGGDDAMIAALVGDYVATTPGLVDDLSVALDKSDFPAAREAAHALKGSSLMVGALRLSETCRMIQSAIDSGDHAAARLRSDAVRGEYDGFKKEVGARYGL
ncbi:MAG: response regulator [Alphaproteobacteria bacterium]|nr:response regulator [Alphaproteobacteria bacterium]